MIFGRSSILKIYRRLEPGPHPELELGRFLRKVGFADVPAVLGSMEYTTGLESSALAVLHALVPDSTDGWEHALEHVGQYLRTRRQRPDGPRAISDAAGHAARAPTP